MKNSFLLAAFMLVVVTTQARWKKTSPLPGEYSQNIHSLTAIGDTIYVSTDRGIFVTTDDGAHWIEKNNGLTNLLVNEIAINGKYIYAATNGGVFLSTDKAASWNPAYTKEGTSTVSAKSIVISKGVVFAGTSWKGVYFSKDNGKTWETFNNELSEMTIGTMAVSNKYIYAGDYDEGVFRSSDDGKTWSVINSGLPDKYKSINTLTADGDNIFLGTYGKGIFLLEDEETNWKEINNGLTRDYIQSILVEGQNIIAASHGGGSGGTFQSADYGKNWETINDGISERKMTALCMTGENIFIGNIYGQVYIQAVSELITSAEDQMINFSNPISLDQNFPNPFKENTTINYSVSFSQSSENLTLKVYDTVGNEIKTLVNGKKEPGDYSVVFDGSLLPAGIYSYKLISANHSVVKQMILSK